MLVVRAAPSPTLCLDTATPLGDTALQAAAQRGYGAIGTYPHLLKKGDPERYCATKLPLGGTMGLFFIMYSRPPGWQPTATTGEIDARDALSRLADLGIPPGAHVWEDWENPAQDSAPVDCIAHLDAVSQRLVVGRYPCGLYIGDDPILSGSEFYDLQYFTRYGLSASDVLDRFGNAVVPRPRGYSWRQVLPLDSVLEGSGGTTIDSGILSPDWLGGCANLVYQW